MKKFLLWLYGFNENQYFIVSIITVTIGLWFPLIINFFGTKFNLIRIENDPVTGLSEKHLTVLGAILTTATILWTFFSALAQRYHSYYKKHYSDFSDDEGKLRILEPVIEAFYEVCNVKLGNSLCKLYDIKFNSISADQSILELPCEQLSEINKELRRVLSNVLTEKKNNLKIDDFYIGIFYNFPLENKSKWFVAEKKGTAQGLTMNDLCSGNSAFKKLLNDNSKNFLFYNSKQEAYNAQCYIPDEEDVRDKKTGELKGSIFCYKHSFNIKGKNIINCMICVSTYNKRFLLEYNEEIIQSMENTFNDYIFKQFSKRIGIELARYYFNYIRNKNSNADNVEQGEV